MRNGDVGESEAHRPARIINPSVHQALIKLIPIQAQKIRQKSMARMDQGATSPSRIKPEPEPKSKPKPKEKKVGPVRAVRWEEDEKEKELKEQEEFDRIWENDCESRARACEDTLSKKLSQFPNRAGRITACLEVLRDVCVVCPPFSRVLGDIFEELELALFCNVLDKDNKKLQVLYMDLVRKFETEIQKKEESQESWKDSLSQYQAHIERIENDMESLTSQVTNADFLNKNLTASLAAATDSLDSANEQVNKSKHKLLTLKKELKDARAEVRRSKSFDVQLKHEKDLMEQNQLKSEYTQLVTELQHFHTFLDMARSQVSASVPRADYLIMKAQMLELQQRLVDIHTKSVELTYQTAHLTPRPTWDKQAGEGDKTLSTLEQVAQICRQNAALSNKLALLQGEWTNTNVALAEANERFEIASKAGNNRR